MCINWKIIHKYTRADAIRDGVLVDLRQGELAEVVENAGIKVPVAMTRTAFERYVSLTQAAQEAGNDIKGRLWDILWMYRCAAQKNPHESVMCFSFYCVVDQPKPKKCEIKVIVGPGDDPAPVLTFLLPKED